jgi:hypothetical protein
MDSVTVKRRGAQFVLGIFSIWAILLLVACAPPTVTDPNKKDPANTTDPAVPGVGNTPTPPTATIPPVSEPKGPTPLVSALWEKSNPKDGASWTSYALTVVKDYGSNLVAGTTDVTNFCPAYLSLNADQKMSFWVYLVSAVTKFESGYSPTNRFRESTMGTDPITKQQVWSEGLLQLSYQDSLNYKFCNEFDWSKDSLLAASDSKKTILDPYKNLKCGIRIMNQIMGSHHAIAYGSGHYWSTLKTTSKYNKVKEIQALTNQVAFCRK